MSGSPLMLPTMTRRRPLFGWLPTEVIKHTFECSNSACLHSHEHHPQADSSGPPFPLTMFHTVKSPLPPTWSTLMCLLWTMAPPVPNSLLAPRSLVSDVHSICWMEGQTQYVNRLKYQIQLFGVPIRNMSAYWMPNMNTQKVRMEWHMTPVVCRGLFEAHSSSISYHVELDLGDMILAHKAERRRSIA